MRNACMLFCLAFSNLLFSQNDFAEQLKQIISDTGNHFQKFKGIKIELSDSESVVYNSTITLAGTKDNWVTIHRSICSYSAKIADSLSKNSGEKILERWKKKIMSVYDRTLSLTKRNFKPESLIIDGYSFSKGSFSISIYLSQNLFDRRIYHVGLFISNEHPTPK